MRRHDQGTTCVVVRSILMKQHLDIRFPLWIPPAGAARHRNIMTATVLSGAAILIGSAMGIAHFVAGSL
jgi:hypothetical protein